MSDEEKIDALLYALWTIANNTEISALKHLDYDHLASNIYATARSALDEVGSDEDDFLRLMRS